MGKSKRAPYKAKNKDFGIIYGAKWNNLPVAARVVNVVIGTAPKETWWTTGMEGKRRKVVEVSQADKQYYLDFEDGKCVWKLTMGRGAPALGYKTVPVERVLEDDHEDIKVFYTQRDA